MEGLLIKDFETIVHQYPDHIAIEEEQAVISYRELNVLANRLAYMLREISGVSRSAIVSVIMPSGINLVTALLATFKAGGIYLPVDLSFVKKRIAHIYNQTACEVIVTTEALKEEVTGLAEELDLRVKYLFILDEAGGLTCEAAGRLMEFSVPAEVENPELVNEPEDGNYIFYTSGSTGEPKAMLGAHRSLYHFINWQRREFKVHPGFKVSQLTQITFDASLRDIFLPLATGGVLCIPSAETKTNPAKLLQWIQQSRINLVHCVPSLFRLITKEIAIEGALVPFENLRHILVAGEILYARDIQGWRQYAGDGVEVVNMYGASETTLVKTFHRIQEVPKNPAQAMHVGKPIDDTFIAIINADGNICRIGEIGEIYIKTAFATKGYFKNETLTKQVFVQNPLIKDREDTIYKTGDMGRYLSDRSVEVLGRLDDQVKINGIRVELDEIKKAVLLSDDVDAYIIANKNAAHENELVCYYVGEVTTETLRERLKQELNDYLIPSFFIRLQEFPLTLNGKIDKKALPKPDILFISDVDYEPVINDVEAGLEGIFKEILGLGKIGRKVSFFKIGGSSLNAMQVISRVYKQWEVSLKIADVFAYPTIAELALLVQNGRKEVYHAIQKVPEAAYYPLSHAQSRLWILNKFEELQATYNMAVAVRIKGALDKQALEAALQNLVNRHESLRTVFTEIAGIPYQQVLTPEEAGFILRYEDVSTVQKEETAIKAMVEQYMALPFDLAKGPLFRACLIRLASGEHIFIYAMHHIVSDGWSMELIVKELFQNYRSISNGGNNVPAPLGIQYKDYAAWQQEQLTSGLLDASKAYWLSVFGGELPVLSVPADRPRPVVKTFNGAEYKFRLDPDLSDRLKALAQQQDASLYMVLLSAVYTLLFRYTGEEDIIIGTPVAGRDHKDLEDQIGFYVNTLPIRARIKGTDSCLALLQEIREKTLGAYAHQRYPFDKLVEALNLVRDTSRSALFDIMVVLQNIHLSEAADTGIEGLQMAYFPTDQQTSKFDLLFNFYEDGADIGGFLQYNTDLFDRWRIEKMVDHLLNLLSAIAATPQAGIGTLRYLSVAEEEQLVSGFNTTQHTFPEQETLVSLFEARVEADPEATAVVFENAIWTYAQINKRSDELATYLRNECRVKENDLVALLLERSEWMVIALLGVLKAGAAYLPIDPAYPEERKLYMLQDAGVKVLIVDEYTPGLELSTPVTILRPGDCTGYTRPVQDAYRLSPDNLAYVIYTSGSTGRPKGVMVPHRGVVNRIYWMMQQYGFAPADAVLQKTPYVFDVSVWEFFMTLCYGGKLVLCRKEVVFDPDAIIALAAAESVAHMHFVPSMFAVFLHALTAEKAAKLHALRHIYCSGEALSAELVRLHHTLLLCPLHNLYGPTEASVDVTYYETGRQDMIVPVGKPIYNTQLYILDEARQLLPAGVPGELYIGGTGLAKGYLNKPELTAERFVPDPFASGTLYRTGDEARWLPDGNIEYLGRLDDQVKIRGYRIELGEIEQALLQHDVIREAIVLIREDQARTPCITAYFVADTPLENRELRDFLVKSLPEYMIPVYFVGLEIMPLTTNGKADRKALPDPGALATQQGKSYEAPGSLLEAQLAEIWQEVIGRRDIGATDNFFEIGGHSLKATRLVYRIHESLNRKLELKDIFLYPTIRGLSGLLEQTVQQAFEAIPAAAEQEHYELSHAQRRLWVLDKLILDPLAYSMPAAVKLTGAIDRDALQMALKALVERHESLRTVFITVAEEPRQKIIPAAAFSFEMGYTDLRNQEQEVWIHIREAFDTPFNLEHGPLFKASLLQLADDEYVFVYVMHHIVSDGWSLEILIRDLMQLYKGRIQEEQIEPASLPVQYKDYAAWQNEQIRSGAMDASEEYWLQQFRGAVPVLSLSTDYVRPAVMSNAGRNLKYQLGKDLGLALKKCGEQEGASLYMVLLTGLYTLLYRYTGQEDLVIGTPIAGRTHKDLEHQIGFFVNTLALRNRFKGTDSCLQLLRSSRDLTLNAFAHQQYPFDMLVDNLNLDRDTSRSPLFDVMISLEDATAGQALATGQEGIEVSDIHIEAGISNFDLSFDFIETSDDLVLKLQYNTSLFSLERMERMLEHYKNILTEITADQELSLKDISYLSETETQQLLFTFNDTAAANPGQANVLDLFEEQVQRKPEAPALVFESRELTYNELNTEANKLAHYLASEFQVRPEDHIGLMVNRSERMIIYLLAILKTGAAYVPIDPEYPVERVRYMIGESGLQLLLTDQDNLEGGIETAVQLCNPEQEVEGISLQPASNPETAVQPDHSAYIIFTSGSTGLPKAVAVSHGNLLNIALGWRDAYELDKFEVCLLQMASISFDVFCGDLCRSLLNGGKMVVVPSGQRMDLEAMYTLISHHRVNILEATPALVIPLMDMIYENGYDISFLKILILGSDTCNADDFNRLLTHFGNQMRLINSYGTTETTIDSSFYEGKKAESLQAGNVPIGRPMRNTSYYILDAHQQIVPVGHKGELYIGGAGVSKGYLNQPRLNEERFLPDPFNPGAKMYRTGDWASWTEEGNACFWGRDDQQVKLRGYRIELGEIDHAVSGFEGIHQALTIVQGKGEDQELVTYFTARAAVDTGRLRDHLNRLLPAYMVPAGLIILDAFPLNSNGKIDKKALPDPKLSLSDSNNYHAPETVTEHQLAAIWADILGREQISTKDNFFEIGGHSLKATRVISRIHKMINVRLPLRAIFAHPTIQSLAVAVNVAIEEKHGEIKALPEQEYYALSHAQRRLWILRQLDEDKTAYNIPDVYEIKGTLQFAFLEKALNTLVSRHESLRTVFITVGEEPMQKIIPATTFSFQLEYEDLRNTENREQYTYDRVAAQAATCFDLGQGPLFRAAVIQVAEDRSLFAFTTHHIISDGWSMAVLIRELLALYQGYLAGTGIALPELRLQYRDYAAWQQEQLADDDNIHRRYWLAQFSDSVPVLELQPAYPRPLVKTYNGKTLSIALDKETYEAIQLLSRQCGATLFMSLLAAVKALLFRYTGQTDMVLGTPIAGRNHIDLEQQVGFFVNTLVLRTQFDASDSFAALLGKVKEVTLKAYEHQIYPFDRLVDDLKLNRDMSRSPLFDVMVVLQNTGEEEITTDGLQDITVKGYALETGISKFDLSFNFLETEQGLRLDMEYNTDLFTEVFIRHMLQHWCNFMCVVARDPGIALHAVNYLEQSEREQILYEFNNTIEPYSEWETIHSLFEKQALLLPHQVALRQHGRELTYKDLNEKANRIAGFLMDAGVQVGDNVGIIADRNFDMIAGLFAIMKAGAAYVPIDPVYPEDRQLYIMNNSAVSAVLVDGEYPVVLKHAGFNVRYFSLYDPAIDHFDAGNPVVEKSPADLAYTIYTSGSTGRPKGVMISHNSAVNLIEWVNKTYAIGTEDRLLFITSICFDLSVYDIFGILAAGGTVVIARQDEVTDVEQLQQLLVEERITFWDSVPTTMNYLVQEIEATHATFRRTDLRLVFMSGDWIPVNLPGQIRQYFPNAQVISLGGATEGTVWSNFYPVTTDMSSRLSVPYGKPLTNNFFYILDEHLNPVPRGVMGELYIGGIGVAQGYAKDAEKTAYSYLPDPFQKSLGGRMYRTGDLGRMLEDWNMEFMGRKDHQVKIRGFRVELGEIKNTLLQHEMIKEVLVTAEEKAGRQKYLVAYFVSMEDWRLTSLKSYLAQHLPEYMIPSYFIRLEAFPLTSNGKIDYKALPKPELHNEMASYKAPQTKTEQALAAIWQEVLQVDQVGATDNFFDLGGHSLIAAKVVSRVAKMLQVKISMKDIFLNPSLETLAKVVEQATATVLTEIRPVTVQEDYELSHAQKRLWIQEQYADKTAVYNIPVALKLEGDINPDLLTRVFYLLLERHEILRTVFITAAGVPRQKILPAVNYPLVVHYKNVGTISDADLRDMIMSETNPLFNLSQGPLWEVKLLRRSGAEVILLVNMHHIISDGWSIELLTREAWTYYRQLVTGAIPQPVPLKLQYKDYTAWHNEQLSGGILDEHRKYWHRQLEGPLPALIFPTDYPRPVIKTYTGTEFSFEIPGTITEKLRAAGTVKGASLFMALLAGVKVLLWYFTKQEDLVVGSIHAGRVHPDLEEQIGFYVNTLALRTRLHPEQSFLQLLDHVKETVLGAYEHQAYPFDLLVTELDQHKDKSRSPLFDVYVDMMNVNGLQMKEEQHDEPGMKDWPLDSNNSKYDLSFRFLDTGNTLRAILEYNTGLFTEGSMQALSKALLRVLEQVAANPELVINTIGLEEQHKEQDISWKEKSFDFSF